MSAEERREVARLAVGAAAPCGTSSRTFSSSSR